MQTVEAAVAPVLQYRNLRATGTATNVQVLTVMRDYG